MTPLGIAMTKKKKTQTELKEKELILVVLQIFSHSGPRHGIICFFPAHGSFTFLTSEVRFLHF